MERIPTRERLIFALDVPDAALARNVVEQLGDSVEFYKLGLELMMAGGYHELLDWVVARKKKVFADLKFYDIPATVAAAVRQLTNRGITYATVHGHRQIMDAAVEAGRDVGILAVTVLTSFDAKDLDELGTGIEVKDLVVSRAKGALAAGCAGVIASGHEAALIRAAVGNEFKVVTPGIRPAQRGGAQRPDDDQKRVFTVEQAFAAGASHIVVGRPIRDAKDPRAAAEAIQASIAAALAGAA